MIGYLRGRLARAEPDRLLIDVGGVGYDLHVPLSTYYEAQKVADEAGEAGGEVELFVHTHVREDALQLFGFWTDLERRLFLKLVAISGIGPKLGQGILSGMPPAELVAAITGGDLVRLNKIPGVGKKTAERMVLELRDKLSDLAASATTAAPARLSSGDDDLVLALVNLGYKRLHAERALSKVEAELPFAERLKTALRFLSKA